MYHTPSSSQVYTQKSLHICSFFEIIKYIFNLYKFWLILGNVYTDSTTTRIYIYIYIQWRVSINLDLFIHYYVLFYCFFLIFVNLTGKYIL